MAKKEAAKGAKVDKPESKAAGDEKKAAEPELSPDEQFAEGEWRASARARLSWYRFRIALTRCDAPAQTSKPWWA